MATTYQVFEKAVRVEELSAELYRLLAEQFAADEEARALFLRLEKEELQHASRVKLLAARYRHDPRLLGGGPGSAADLEPLLAEVSEAVSAVRGRTFARSFDEARTRSAELEERMARAHAELITREGHPALREFFGKLAEQDRGHRELLRR